MVGVIKRIEAGIGVLAASHSGSTDLASEAVAQCANRGETGISLIHKDLSSIPLKVLHLIAK